MCLPLTLTDTLQLYRVDRELPWVMLLDETGFQNLPPQRHVRLLETQTEVGRGGVQRLSEWTARLSRADAELLERSTTADLFLWWPGLRWSLSEAGRETVLLDFLTEDRLPHRGLDLTDAHWKQIDHHLPGVQPLAGTFAPESGANCLSTTVAAFGHLAVADLWLHQGPFERWLEGTTPDVAPETLGAVLVWRDGSKHVQHAAVSLGEGWAFQKDAQGWFAPRQIVRLSDLLARWNTPGWTATAYGR